MNGKSYYIQCCESNWRQFCDMVWWNNQAIAHVKTELCKIGLLGTLNAQYRDTAVELEKFWIQFLPHLLLILSICSASLVNAARHLLAEISVRNNYHKINSIFDEKYWHFTLSTLRSTLEWNPQGFRRRGCPKQSWRWRVQDELAKKNFSWIETKRTAKNRVRWRSMVDALCSPSGVKIA